MSGSVVRRDNYCGIKAVRYLLWTLPSGGSFRLVFVFFIFIISFCWKKRKKRGKGDVGTGERGKQRRGKGV